LLGQIWITRGAVTAPWRTLALIILSEEVNVLVDREETIFHVGFDD